MIVNEGDAVVLGGGDAPIVPLQNTGLGDPTNTRLTTFTVKDAVDNSPILSVAVMWLQPRPRDGAGAVAILEDQPTATLLRFGFTDANGQVTLAGPASPRFTRVHLVVTAFKYVPFVWNNYPVATDQEVGSPNQQIIKLSTPPLVDVPGDTVLEISAAVDRYEYHPGVPQHAVVWATADSAGTSVVAGPMPVFDSGLSYLYLKSNATRYLWYSSPWYRAKTRPLGVAAPAGAARWDVALPIESLPVGTGSGHDVSVRFQDVCFRSTFLPGVMVWLTTDAQGQTRVGGAGYTAADGDFVSLTGGYFKFQGLADGTYYLWAAAGLEFVPLLAKPITVAGANVTQTLLLHRHRVGVENHQLTPNQIQVAKLVVPADVDGIDATLGLGMLTSGRHLVIEDPYERGAGPGSIQINSYLYTFAGPLGPTPAGLVAFGISPEQFGIVLCYPGLFEAFYGHGNVPQRPNQ